MTESDIQRVSDMLKNGATLTITPPELPENVMKSVAESAALRLQAAEARHNGDRDAYQSFMDMAARYDVVIARAYALLPGPRIEIRAG